MERQKQVNLLLIGLGYHAKRIYYPCLEESKHRFGAKVVCVLDLESKKSDIENYLSQREYPKPQLLFLADEERNEKTIPKNLEKILTKTIAEKEISAVIISTEPLAHMVYARWALKNGLSILMDKPISTKTNIIQDLKKAKEIISDYEELLTLLRRVRCRNPVVFNLMAQRRYHLSFLKVRDLIREVFKKTNCPVTSIQSFHSDGQWRMPEEIVTQNYHPYNQGYGKCSHSGYHSIDIVPWFMEAAESEEKRIDNVEIYSSFVKPNDFISQLNRDDYRRFFPNYDSHFRLSDKKLRKIYDYGFGEIDAFNLLSFKHDSSIITQASVNLIHNGFSQRNWVTTKGRDLYKGNGRIRHESHYIEQGPFQAISLISYQSEEVNPDKNENVFDMGGESHIDVNVFRNSKMFPSWKTYEKFSGEDMHLAVTKGLSRGHQEEARRDSIDDFLFQLKGKSRKNMSPIESHYRSTLLLSGIYQSSCLRENGRCPTVKLDFKRNPF